MPEVVSETIAKTSLKVTYLKDYQPPTFLVDQIYLEFDLNDGVTTVKSRMQCHRNSDCSGDHRDFILNGEELTLKSILLNGKPLEEDAYTCTEHYLVLRDVPERFELEILNDICPEKNTALSGLYQSSGAYCTQCEAEGFRRITFFPDRPDVLSRFTVKITADKSRFPHLLSNGNLIAHGELEDGRHYAMWEDPFKKPCYLFALVAGDFDLIEDTFTTQSGKKAALKFYTEKGYGDQAQHAVHALKEAMRWDEKVYGREYDLDVYMIAAMSDFNMGAMENKGLNIFNTKYVLAKPETATDENYIHILSVIAHEYFHNWTGNRVTCRDWFQLSLKEGLTIFRDQSFTEDTLSHAVMRIQDVTALRESQFPEDASPLAHPVRPESYIEINNFYTATVYNKGAEVLRMLHTMLGREKYRKAMDLYFERFDGQAVTINDYVAVMEEVSGMDLTQFKRWYSQAGTPVVSVDDDYDATKKVYNLRLNQSCASTPGQKEKLPFHIPIRVGLLDARGEPLIEETVLHFTDASQQFTFENIAECPTPSLLRNFSAPVKLKYPYSNEILLFLAQHDADPFNRWEAMQRYLLRMMLEMIREHSQGCMLHLPPELPAAFDRLLHEENQDYFFIAEMLTLPSENYIGEQMEVVDPESIHIVRQFVLKALAEVLESKFKNIYDRHHAATKTYHFTMEEVGKRQLKNRCLFYLMQMPSYLELGLDQFNASLKSNMTDTMAVLSQLANIDDDRAAKGLDSFYQTWQHDALVLDKWFSVQAVSSLPGTLQTVKNLMRHPSFDIKNPNKVYALIGAFGHRNPFYFHTRDGEGYAFLAQTVQAIDKLNPQIAARMVKPLTSLNRYDKERQALMKTQLEWLLQDSSISEDLYELVSKSLEGVK